MNQTTKMTSKTFLGCCLCLASLTLFLLLFFYVKTTDVLADELIENFKKNLPVKTSDFDVDNKNHRFDNPKILSELGDDERLESKHDLAIQSKSSLDLVRDFIDQKCYKSDVVQR